MSFKKIKKNRKSRVKEGVGERWILADKWLFQGCKILRKIVGISIATANYIALRSVISSKETILSSIYYNMKIIFYQTVLCHNGHKTYCLNMYAKTN